MKRYIKASINYTKAIQSLKRDRRTAAALDPDITTYEDLKAIDWETGRVISNAVKFSERQGKSVDECIDEVLDTIADYLTFSYDNQNKAAEYLKAVEELAPKLKRFLYRHYDITDSRDIEYEWIVEPTEMDQKACIRFVDDIVAAVDGEYWGTGRGGSWTSWDIKSHDGVMLKAGWTSDDKWYVRIEESN